MTKLVAREVNRCARFVFYLLDSFKQWIFEINNTLNLISLMRMYIILYCLLHLYIELYEHKTHEKPVHETFNPYPTHLLC